MYPIVSGIPQSEIAKWLIQEWTIKSVFLKFMISAMTLILI